MDSVAENEVEKDGRQTKVFYPKRMILENKLERSLWGYPI